MRGVSWRATLIVIVIVVSAFYLVPPSERINLGLDLQGGIHLVLEVQSEKAVESKMSRYFTELRNRLSIDDIRTRTLKRDGLRLTATLHRPADRGRFLTMMQNYPDLTLEREEGAPPTFVYFLSSQQVERTKEQAIIQALETIRNRIDQFGVREPTLPAPGRAAHHHPASWGGRPLPGEVFNRQNGALRVQDGGQSGQCRECAGAWSRARGSAAFV